MKITNVDSIFAVGNKFKVVIAYAPVMGKYIVEVKHINGLPFGAVTFTSKSHAIAYASAFLPII